MDRDDLDDELGQGTTLPPSTVEGRAATTGEAMRTMSDRDREGLRVLAGGQILPRRRGATPARRISSSPSFAGPRPGVVSTADREFRALVRRRGGDEAAAQHLGLDREAVSDAAEARSERLYWTVSDPHHYPGPLTHGAIAGAWLQGVMCAAVIRSWDSAPPLRPIGTGDLMMSVRAFEAECDKTGNSRAALARFDMVRSELQPQFGGLAPERAVAAICAETGAPEEVCRDLLGLFAVDGAAVVRYALERVATDPSPPPADITAAVASYRLHRAALSAAQANLASVVRDLMAEELHGSGGRRPGPPRAGGGDGSGTSCPPGPHLCLLPPGTGAASPRRRPVRPSPSPGGTRSGARRYGLPPG